MAVACDDGVLRIFTAEGLSPGLTYHWSMPALGSRLLSVAWHPSGQSVLVGTAISTMHVWQLASSRELMRINIGALPIPRASHHARPKPVASRTVKTGFEAHLDPFYRPRNVRICACIVLMSLVEHMWAPTPLLSSKASATWEMRAVDEMGFSEELAFFLRQCSKQQYEDQGFAGVSPSQSCNWAPAGEVHSAEDSAPPMQHLGLGGTSCLPTGQEPFKSPSWIFTARCDAQATALERSSVRGRCWCCQMARW